MSGLSVLHFGGIDRHSIVDHRHVIATVGNGSDGMARTSGSVGGKVSGLGMLDLGSLDGSTMGVSHLTQSLGMSSIVFSLSSLDIGCIDWDTAMGEGYVGRSSAIGPATTIDRTLVKMMTTSVVSGSGMSSSMGSLGVLNFGCVNGHAAVGQNRDVDSVSIWHVSGMAMSSGIDRSNMGYSWSLGQIGANGIEAMMWISSV